MDDVPDLQRDFATCLCIRQGLLPNRKLLTRISYVLVIATIFNSNHFFFPLLKAYGDTILRFSDTYVQQRPANYPAHIGWPDKTQIVDAIAEVARLKFP